ncbi:apolipoprotein D-like [Microplitis mediator]|uniref:apolipoprotein D-like n=1 Tax=Microplitis mediator TaxID=375433 RepID=UPI0025520EE3|nr:apolipoprotein D-like [Microplitis mediator]
MKAIITIIFAISFLAVTNAHTYHMGECPVVEPMHGFQMSKFLGYWNVIQKTSTASKCVGYNYTRGDEPGQYTIIQESNHPVLGLTPLKHEYRYTGELNVPEPSTPALMQVRFPLSVAGSASHVVFATDYDNYAGIFTCQKLGFAHRRSATILSRTKELDKSKIDALRNKLSSFNVDPFDLSIVPQTGCDVGQDPVKIDINPDTFSSENVGNIFRKAGGKIKDGFDWVVNAGNKVYHKIAGSESNNSDKDDLKNQQPANVRPISHPKMEPSETNEVEWIP